MFEQHCGSRVRTGVHREAPDGLSWSVLAALEWLNHVTGAAMPVL